MAGRGLAMSDEITAEEARKAYEVALRRIRAVEVSNAAKLNLSDLLLRQLPPEIGRLGQLEILILRNTSREGKHPQLAVLPDEITQLSRLKVFDLSGNRLISLPAKIGQLTNLQRLYLNGNQLSRLPGGISQLANLQVLYLSHNQLSNLPAEISQLTNLQGLYLDHNQLTSLPAEISQLTSLQRLYLFENPGLPIPLEIIMRFDNPAAILAYWAEYLATAPRPLNEAKMVLVGQGGVGKTSLVQRLVYERYNPDEKQTKGINIEAWALPLGNKKVRLNIWDFGGQEIMHATHQFFLTARTLYLLVLDARQGEQEGRLEYWLTLIQSFAGDSPVIVVMNKCDEHHLDLNRRGLQQKYPTIQNFVSVSARSGKGMEELKRAIRQAVTGMPHIDSALPANWYRVKERLTQSRGRQDYIPYGQYQELCRQTGVEDDTSQRTLIRFLHDLGAVLNFQDDDRVRDTSVLNPEWVTQAVYSLLNHEKLVQARGVVTRRQLPEILDHKRYPVEQQRLILNLMEKFELAFAFEGSNRYLVPDLLPVEQPQFAWEEGGSLLFEYRYAVLPRSVLHRFMVRLHPFIYEKIAWRTGVMLAYEGMRALVKADIEDKRISIAILGKGRRREFLSMLRFTFASLHQSITGTQPEEYVPIPEESTISVPYAYLLTLEENSVRQAFVPGLKKPVDVQVLLGTIEDPMRRWRPTPQELRDVLHDNFSDGEFREMCDRLRVPFVDLGGESTAAKMREAVAYMERRGRINELIEYVQEERPRVVGGWGRP